MTLTTIPKKTDDGLSSVVSIIGWSLLLVVPLSVYYSVNWDAIQITDSMSHCIMLLLCAVIMWVFRLLPDVVPSVFLLIGLLSLEVAPPEIVFSGYGSKVFFLALSVLSLSSVIKNSGLSQRILAYVVYKWQPKTKTMFAFIVFIFGMLTTPFIPSTNGRAALIAPFLDDALTQIGQSSKEHQRLVSALLNGISLISPVFVSAKSINLLVWGMLSIQDQYSFNYLFWIIAALVPGIILVILFLMLQAVVFFNTDKILIDKEEIESMHRNMPKRNQQETIGIIALVSFILLILTYSYHHIEIHLIAFILFFALLFFNVLNQKLLSESIDWSFLIFLGAMSGFANVLQFLELTDLVTTKLSWLTGYMDSNIYLFILLLSAMVFLFRLFVSINTAVILLAGALMPAAGNYAWVVGFIILMMSESFIWPYQASYYIQCVSILGERHFKALHANRVYVVNGCTLLLKLVAIYLSVPYWRFLGIL